MEFEPSILEKDIERLAKEAGEYKEQNKIEKIDESVLKAIIGNRLPPKPVTVNYQDGGEAEKQSETPDIFPNYLKKESPEVKLKVEELVGVAFSRGIDKAVEEARKSDPFILDAFHDVLTAKLYDELKKRNLL